MFSPESSMGKLQQPSMPGLMNAGHDANPFAGIRRAGQAKRAQNFEKFQNAKGPGQDASFAGAKNQSFGGEANTQVGSMRQMRFA